METIRDQSIRSRADDLKVPDLDGRERIVQGAGNYNAMCTGCHLKPGANETELSKGLYPAPPDLTRTEVDVAEAFWVIKHGIKASGMPAWGKSMEDEYIWNLVAFIRQLPTLDPQAYQSLVASSGGHSHGGGESDGHSDAEGEKAPHDHAMAEDANSPPADDGHDDHDHAATIQPDLSLPLVTVHKSPTCDCCTGWVQHMREAGFRVEVRDVDNLDPVKTRLEIPYGKGSCHTAEVGGYFVEGHVPASDIKRLLTEKPDAKGLVLPGMPLGSPGMEVPGGTVQPYTVEIINQQGEATAFARH